MTEPQMHTYVLPILKNKNGILTIKGDVAEVLAGHVCLLRRKRRHFTNQGVPILFAHYLRDTDRTLVGLPGNILLARKWTHLTVNSLVYHPLAHKLSARFTDPTLGVRAWRRIFPL